jgi:pyruvate/2-oxoglutarate dehydrogenase complex dihydrolipoamide dehydrogenase (E3) component
VADVDLLVVGAGAGGLAAAREGVRVGRRTVLVTEGPPGGDCTFTGCVPSKTLLAAAARGEPAAIALAQVRATVARVAATETATVLRGEGVEVREGRARFVAARAVEVAGLRLTARSTVLACGSSPRPAALSGLDTVAEDSVLTTDTVFSLDDAPPSMVVVGGGPVGCELAQAFARLGTAVTLVEAAQGLLPGEDPDVGAVLATVLSRDGVDVRVGAGATAVAPGPRGVRVSTADGGRLDAARLLMAIGRRPAVDDLGLDAAGVARTASGAVAVDAHLRTTAEGVWAAGDVTGLCPHTHAADEMGRLAAANATRRRSRRFEPGLVPRVVFTDPEVATIGLGEAAAAGRGPAWVAEVAMSEVDRAVTAGREDGFVRLVAAAPRGTRRLTRGGLGPVGGGRPLGATIVADRAGEMIAEIALVMRIGALTGRLAQTVHAYPTWTLAVRQAAARLALSGGGARRARAVPPFPEEETR